MAGPVKIRNENGNGRSFTTFVLAVVTILVAGGIVGGIRLAVAQAECCQTSRENKISMMAHEDTLRRVDVMEARLANLTDKLTDVKNDNNEAHLKIEARLEASRKEILGAIEKVTATGKQYNKEARRAVQ